VPAKLTLFPTRAASRHHVLEEGEECVVGRDPGSDMAVDDPRVSARHARLSWTGSAWQLVDLASKNGTFLDGARVGQAPLVEESWLSFGGLLARFERVSLADVELLRAERAERLATVADARHALGPSLDPRELLRRLIGSVLSLTGAERGFVLLFRSDGELYAEVASGFPGGEPFDERFTGSFGAIERALKTVSSVVSSNATADAFLGKRRSVVEMGIETLACVPLRSGGLVIGLIYVDGRRKGGVFTDLDLEILEALAGHAALVVGGLRLERQIRELVGASAAGSASDGGRFLEDLERRAGQIARASVSPERARSRAPG
jgi:hypothetical protein